MNTTNATKSKYRPVLTALQITHILELAKLESPLSDLSISVISTLSPFEAKIKNAGISPAYTPKPVKQSTLESLGGLSSTSIEQANNMSKEEYWAQCYAKYVLSPITCSLEEIQAATEHKYLNDLLNPKELAAFEARDSAAIDTGKIANSTETIDNTED